MKERKSFGESVKDNLHYVFRHENVALLFVLIALIFGTAYLTKGTTITRTNVRNVLVQSSVRGIVSIGQAFVVLSSGIDVSVGGIGLFSSILGSSLMTLDYKNIVGHPIAVPVAVLIMIAAGTAWGLFNGILISRIKMPALIVTLGMWQITRGAAFRINHGYSISNLPDSLAFWGQGNIAGVETPIIIFIAVAIIAYFVLNRTSFGRGVYATGGNMPSAWLSGIPVRNYQLFVYVIAGFLAGIGAVVMTGRVMSASMLTLNGLELDTIASVFVGGVSLAGGKGNLIGVIFGVLIIGVLNNTLSVLGTGPDMQGFAKGAIIIAAVAIDYLRRRETIAY